MALQNIANNDDNHGFGDSSSSRPVNLRVLQKDVDLSVDAIQKQMNDNAGILTQNRLIEAR